MYVVTNTKFIDVVIQSDQSTATIPTISTVSTVPIDDDVSRRKLFCSKMHQSFKFYQDVCQSKHQSLLTVHHMLYTYILLHRFKSSSY